MTDMSEYLTGEVVVDYADGLVDRREALRRLGLLGVAAGVAVTMLAACDASDPQPTRIARTHRRRQSAAGARCGRDVRRRAGPGAAGFVGRSGRAEGRGADHP